jgi:UDP-N-acetyl-D-mannosaminuronate dehydrogenase
VTVLVVSDLGYVGLTLGSHVVTVGHDSAGYVIDPVGVNRLEAAESYVEGGPSTELAAALDSAGSIGRRAPTRGPASTSQ